MSTNCIAHAPPSTLTRIWNVSWNGVKCILNVVCEVGTKSRHNCCCCRSLSFVCQVRTSTVNRDREWRNFTLDIVLEAKQVKSMKERKKNWRFFHAHAPTIRFFHSICYQRRKLISMFRGRSLLLSVDVKYWSFSFKDSNGWNKKKQIVKEYKLEQRTREQR